MDGGLAVDPAGCGRRDHRQLLPWGVAFLAVSLVAAGMGMWESRRRGGAQGS